VKRPQALKRHERIRLPNQFRNIILKGKRFKGDFLILYCLKRSGKDGETRSKRLGVVVSKRVLRKSHDRNKIKRLLREVFRRNKPKFQQGADLVFRLFSKPNLFSYNNIEKECLKLAKLGRLI